MTTQYMKITQGHIEGLPKAPEKAQKNNEAAIKNLEIWNEDIILRYFQLILLKIWSKLEEF